MTQGSLPLLAILLSVDSSSFRLLLFSFTLTMYILCRYLSDESDKVSNLSIKYEKSQSSEL